jgi:uncharacterized protein YndB with AHSA1/START domain
MREENIDMNGQLEALATGRWTLRFTRQLPHPIDKVWRAVTQPEHLPAWFPDRMVGDLLVPGGELRFESAGGQFPPFDGRVLRVEPPNLLEFLWGTDTIRFELEASDGGCTFTLTDTIDELGKAARDGAGWHTCLDFLEAHLDGIEPSFTTRDRWQSVLEDYQKAFGPEASTIGPPSG